MRESNVPLYTAITIISTVLLGAYIALSVVIGSEFAIPALITGGVVGAIVLKGPVGKALAERIHDGTVGAGEVPPELLQEMDDMRNRMVELEERVDFTERLLARHRADDPAALPPG
jgi:hypothetical protein